jgi:hypothetical protein
MEVPKNHQLSCDKVELSFVAKIFGLLYGSAKYSVNNKVIANRITNVRHLLGVRALKNSRRLSS